LDKFILPTHLPVSVPSQLVRQRPDIRASEALLHSASAQVGVATANLFPQITLTGGFGWVDPILGGLISSPNLAWNVGANLLQPVFNGGALRAKDVQRLQDMKQRWGQYKQVVLQAFQNVADSLRALENDAKTLKANLAAEIATKQSFHIISKTISSGWRELSFSVNSRTTISTGTYCTYSSTSNALY